MAYGRDRAKSEGSPTQYRQFSFNQGARTYLAGEHFRGPANSAVRDYNMLSGGLQSAENSGKYLSQYNKDKYLTALGYLQSKAQATAEAKYAEYLQTVGNTKFASKPAAGQGLMRAPNEFDLSENTGSYTPGPEWLFGPPSQRPEDRSWRKNMLGSSPPRS